MRELYADEIFFNLRNSLPPTLVQHFSNYFTPDLIKYFESHNEDVKDWMEIHKNEDLKLPMSEGPIFFSNYEGAHAFEVGHAKVFDDHSQVPVSFSYTEAGNTFQWVDIVVLRLVGDAWLLDDIRFDPSRWDSYTLRERVALDK